MFKQILIAQSEFIAWTRFVKSNLTLKYDVIRKKMLEVSWYSVRETAWNVNYMMEYGNYSFSLFSCVWYSPTIFLLIYLHFIQIKYVWLKKNLHYSCSYEQICVFRLDSYTLYFCTNKCIKTFVSYWKIVVFSSNV